MKLSAALLSVLLTGCAHTPQVTFLLGPRQSEGVKEMAATIMVLQPFGENGHGVCGEVHNSEPANGKPANHDDEITFDQLACGFQWGGRERR